MGLTGHSEFVLKKKTKKKTKNVHITCFQCEVDKDKYAGSSVYSEFVNIHFTPPVSVIVRVLCVAFS